MDILHLNGRHLLKQSILHARWVQETHVNECQQMDLKEPRGKKGEQLSPFNYGIDIDIDIEWYRYRCMDPRRIKIWK